MSVLYFLIPLSIGMSLLALLASLWAIRNGQFEDLEGDATRNLDIAPTHGKGVLKKL